MGGGEPRRGERDQRASEKSERKRDEETRRQPTTKGRIKRGAGKGCVISIEKRSRDAGRKTRAAGGRKDRKRKQGKGTKGGGPSWLGHVSWVVGLCMGEPWTAASHFV